MCRLLGYASRRPTTLAGLLGERDLQAFTELSCQHGDGWGLARAGDGAVEVEKAPEAARLSPRFAELAAGHPADLAMVHLRWATLGLPVAPQNAHPFTDGRLAFAHNGSVPPPSALDPLLSEQVRHLLRGDTDSERLFLAVLSRLPAAQGAQDPVGDAYAAAVVAVGERLSYTSLNSMIVTSERLYAVCCYPAEAPAYDRDYFRLGHRTSADAVVVSSSGWSSGWQELPNRHMLVVDRRTLATGVRPLDASA